MTYIDDKNLMNLNKYILENTYISTNIYCKNVDPELLTFWLIYNPDDKQYLLPCWSVYKIE